MKRDGSLSNVVWGMLDQSDLDDAVQLLVAAAVEGPAAFDEAWKGGGTPPRQERGIHPKRNEATGAFLDSISVEGFRGVGPKVVLPIGVGPGLTVVTGRNGSGKSSFAEAVEVALTGKYSRAEGRPAEWREGWRNLHHDRARIEIGLVVEGGTTPATTVRCKWNQDDTKVDAAAISVQRGTNAPEGLVALGWTDAIATYRPFLSHNELGQILIKEPKILFDALSAILGLGDLNSGVARLKTAASEMNEPVKRSKAWARELVDRLGLVDDHRATELVTLLRKRTWDLDRIIGIATGGSREVDGELDQLNRVIYLDFPSDEQSHSMIQGLREALNEVQLAVSDPDIEAADLLERALHWRQHSHNGACPVCGRGLLTDDWAAEAEARVATITAASEATRTARSRLQSALRACRDLVPSLPDRLAETPVPAAAALASGWRDLVAAPDDPGMHADHLELWLPEVRSKLDACVAEARAELQRREGNWRPLAGTVLEWAHLARDVEAATPQRERVERASRWLADAEGRIRNERLQPLASQAAEIWASLRQESNVELGGIMLEGAATRRRVKLDVRIDGSDSSALAVMSQGELNALALSIFLPRATVPESPFRFLVIDDPVQAMDPSKVDGLARVLHSVAKSRQVLVFTHDDRLPEALRRLQLNSTILEVDRHERSVVGVRTVLSPVRRYWDDAAALLRDENVAEVVAERVVPGVLRLALESACQQRIRQQRLGKPGVTHAEVEDLLRDKHQLYPLMALALFDDERRAGDVLTRLNMWGRWAADTFTALNKGAHHGIGKADLDGYCRATRDLIKRLDQWGTE